MDLPLPLTVADIVKSLGGRIAVAELCDVGYTAVSNWISWNRFPDRAALYRLIVAECDRRDVAHPPDSLFRAPPPKVDAASGRAA